MSTYRFSGHETFHCRHFWLKKGYDFLNQSGSFSSNEALVELGVGKNMVTSIGHWMRVFGLLQDGCLTDFATQLFGTDGLDPYLEDRGTMWLLHFRLVNSESSIYKMVFEDFRKMRVSSEFTPKQISEFISRKVSADGSSFSDSTYQNDVKVFLRNYIATNKKEVKALEDDYASVLIGLNLLSVVPDVLVDGEALYTMEYNRKDDLPEEIFLFCLLETFEKEVSISFADIQNKVSDLFLCNRDGTDQKLLRLQESGYLVYKEDAGRREIQLKETIDKWDVLKSYYHGI